MSYEGATDDEATIIEHLRAVIREAAADIDHWGTYASGYFQQKWDLAGDLKKYRALADEPTLELIEQFHEPTNDDPPHCLVDGQAYPCAALRLARRTGGALL